MATVCCEWTTLTLYQEGGQDEFGHICTYNTIIFSVAWGKAD